ncbi:MAG TPA: relaxase/mobilization nuclease domain-containing protein [Pseudolabrys sp.]|nr:relaxase/mobilization nuclease domain-containing protein [Pseudolabrys sp.]
MTPNIGKSTSSFKAIVNYAMHDKNAKTQERVAWTQTRNLANDFVPSAVDEMLWTARDAETLKQEAGVHGGGRPTKDPVKHITLNWAPGDNPSREHMIATTDHFLRHMGWQEHQACYIAHNDKHYAHVHIILNRIHPETGRTINEGYAKRRAQDWALAYEQEQGRIHCEQRLLNEDERQKAMPRNMWMAFKQNEQEFEKSEEQLQKMADIPEFRPENRKKEEWKILFDLQRAEVKQFHADGKTKFRELRSSIYREVKEEFRERWGDYYQAKKKGTEADKDILATLKENLIAEQSAALEPRRDAACKELLATREVELHQLLEQQKITRKEFGWRLDLGLDNAEFLHAAGERRGKEREQTLSAFRDAARETAGRSRLPETSERREAEADDVSGSTRSARDRTTEIVGRRAVSAAVGFADGLFSALINLGSAPKTPSEPHLGERDPFEVAAEEATKQIQHNEREEYDAQWRQRSKELYGE